MSWNLGQGHAIILRLGFAADHDDQKISDLHVLVRRYKCYKCRKRYQVGTKADGSHEFDIGAFLSRSRRSGLIGCMTQRTFSVQKPEPGVRTLQSRRRIARPGCGVVVSGGRSGRLASPCETPWRRSRMELSRLTEESGTD